MWAHRHLRTHWPLRFLIKRLHHPIHIHHTVIRELRPSTSSLPGGRHCSNQPSACLTSIITDQHWIVVIQHTHNHIACMVVHNPVSIRVFCYILLFIYLFIYLSRCRDHHSQLETTLTQNGWNWGDVSLPTIAQPHIADRAWWHWLMQSAVIVCSSKKNTLKNISSNLFDLWIFKFKSFESEELYCSNGRRNVSNYCKFYHKLCKGHFESSKE